MALSEEHGCVVEEVDYSSWQPLGMTGGISEGFRYSFTARDASIGLHGNDHIFVLSFDELGEMIANGDGIIS